jgi:hypothetical protein
VLSVGGKEAKLRPVSDDIIKLFQADYTELVWVAYQRAIVYMFGSCQDLNLLAYASGEDAVDIPSWYILVY